MKEVYSIATNIADVDTAKPVKTPLGYYGCKKRIASKIVKGLPPHNAWVEAFCGSAAITLAKPAAPIEVINDIHGQVVNLFKQLRDNKEALCEAVSLTPYARTEYIEAREAIKFLDSNSTFPEHVLPMSSSLDSEYLKDPLEQARIFLVASMMTVNATIEGNKSGFSFSSTYARGEREARVNRWYNLPDRLNMVAERLRSVRVENKNACKLLDDFINRPATLVYLDPPYLMERSHKYIHDANCPNFHTELLNKSIEAKCMILISSYENDLYPDLLLPANWEKMTIDTKTRGTKGNDYDRTEVLWMNESYIKAKKTGKVPIELSEFEIKQRKVNPERI